MGNFIFNGVSAADLGLVVDEFPAQHAPRKNITTITIPGRSEPLHQWDGSYAPFTKRYVCWFRDTPVAGTAHRVKAWLLSAPAGARLEDTFDEDVYHNATYAGGADIENALDRFGRVTVEFECAAPAYLKYGEMPIRIRPNTPTVIINDTAFPAYPLLTIHGNGSLGCVIHVNGEEINVLWGAGGAVSLCFDCAMHEAWKIVDGVESPANDLFSLTIHSFPQLAPGENTVEIRGVGAEYMELVPRFWTL